MSSKYSKYYLRLVSRRLLPQFNASPLASRTLGLGFSKRFNSNSTTRAQENHSSDTYQKDETISHPTSSKTHVVDGDDKTQRPFEPSTGSYATQDPEQPYDEPIPKSENNHKKPRYGNLNRGSEGGNAPDVDPSGNPSDQGRQGRK
ncbi:hypothetical protein Clacol_001054 [Clathrus columnatus]|uniref:Uncharacterized protein n=1 Tax=Clathrus columnatus TaxID=1419009 RepID=A0AAV5A038_9AGAM|nr:hypothetical protein Clacol_001054 [Clathrus columnatus]